MNILNLIKNGESKTVEFKEKLVHLEGIVRTSVAFANNGGGHILIGIEDRSHRLIGISADDQKNLPDRITNGLFDSIEPKVNFDIQSYTVEQRLILVIEIFPGNQPPYFVKSKGKNKGTFTRVGATVRLADHEAIVELQRRALNVSFDQEPCRRLSIDDLDLDALKTFFELQTNKKLKAPDLVNLGLVKKINKQTFPSVGAVLLCGKTPIHDNCYISCALFKGQNKLEFLDKKDFHGPLFSQIEQTMQFLKRHIPLRARIEGLYRQEKYEVPIEALREALVNSVVHRDYTLSGSHIKVAIFEDRIEFISPGALPRNVTIEDITFGRSEIRNHVIARFFKETNVIEQWGTGISKIIQISKDENLVEPVFSESGNFFKAVIFRTKRKVKDDVLSEQELKILEHLKKHNFIKNADAQKILRVSPSRVRAIFEALVQKGVLQAIGKGKARTYKAL